MAARTVLKHTRPSCSRVILAGLLTLFGGWHIPATAQSRDRGPIVLDLPASTRALALGNTFALGFRDPDAVFYHPGLLGSAAGFAGAIQRFGSSATSVAFSAAGSWLSGGVALGVQHVTYGADAPEPVLGSDLLQLPADIGSLRSDGNVGVSESVLSIGYGRTIKGIQMGLVGKLIEQRFGPHSSGTGAIDFGASASPGPLTLGLAVQNLGPAMEVESEEILLPLRFVTGASTRSAPVGPLDLSASTAVYYRMDGDVIPSLGLEVAYWPVTGRTFVGRLGFRHLPDEQSGCPFTFGGAFLGDDIALEYAYEGFDSGTGSHRFSIGWR